MVPVLGGLGAQLTIAERLNYSAEELDEELRIQKIIKQAEFVEDNTNIPQQKSQRVERECSGRFG